MTATAKKAGFRLGIYVFKDAEIVDFAAPHGVFSVARRYDPELDAFLIEEDSRAVVRVKVETRHRRDNAARAFGFSGCSGDARPRASGTDSIS